MCIRDSCCLLCKKVRIVCSLLLCISCLLYTSYTIVEIISRCKNVVVNGKDRFRSHIGSRKLAGSLTLPVFMYLPKIRLGLLRNIKWISSSGSHRIQFILQPLERILRECLTSSWCQGAASDDQFLITDDDQMCIRDRPCGYQQYHQPVPAGYLLLHRFLSYRRKELLLQHQGRLLLRSDGYLYVSS